jgi:phosphoribosyl 1,2-cyclic phosphodiesterase
MRFSVLSSGSKANCTFIESGSTRILIDCGLSAKEAEKRLMMHGINPLTLDAIIITHEHSDHIYGVPVLSRRFKLPVFANNGTAHHIKKAYGIEKFNSGEAFWIGSVKIDPFSIVHDAADPVGFAMNAEGLKFVQVTDLGRVTPLVKHMLQSANAIVLESNHCQEMLKNCDYAWHLKQRIASSYGHLNNDCAGALLQELVHEELSHIVLAHLSDNSNTPETALNAVNYYINNTYRNSIVAAGVTESTAMVHIAEFDLKYQAVL